MSSTSYCPIYWACDLSRSVKSVWNFSSPYFSVLWSTRTDKRRFPSPSFSIKEPNVDATFGLILRRGKQLSNAVPRRSWSAMNHEESLTERSSISPDAVRTGNILASHDLIWSKELISSWVQDSQLVNCWSRDSILTILLTSRVRSHSWWIVSVLFASFTFNTSTNNTARSEYWWQRGTMLESSLDAFHRQVSRETHLHKLSI